jgi:hypothetical protein
MEFSPLRFLDYDVSLMLSDQVRTTREEQARKYHEKQYKDVESWEIGHYEHYEENYNANQYNLNVACIEAFNSHYKIIDCINVSNPKYEGHTCAGYNWEVELKTKPGSILSFTYISERKKRKKLTPQPENYIVKKIIKNFEEIVFNWEDGVEVYINGDHDDCGKPNYYAEPDRDDDCMCEECRKK